MNMFKKRVYPLPLLDAEYTSAYATAKEFLKKSSFCLDWNACLGNTPAIAFFSEDFVYLKIHILPFYSLLFI